MTASSQPVTPADELAITLLERRALHRSMAASVVLSGLGVGWGIAAGAALDYGLIAGSVSLAVWTSLRGPARRSELLAAEAAQWLASIALGVAVMVASGWSSSSMRSTGPRSRPTSIRCWCWPAAPCWRRSDPKIRMTLVELLEGAPDPEIQLPVRQAVHRVRMQFGLDEPYLRMTKVGPKLYVEVDFLVIPASGTSTTRIASGGPSSSSWPTCRTRCG